MITLLRQSTVHASTLHTLSIHDQLRAFNTLRDLAVLLSHATGLKRLSISLKRLHNDPAQERPTELFCSSSLEEFRWVPSRFSPVHDEFSYDEFDGLLIDSLNAGTLPSLRILTVARPVFQLSGPQFSIYHDILHNCANVVEVKPIPGSNKLYLRTVVEESCEEGWYLGMACIGDMVHEVKRRGVHTAKDMLQARRFRCESWGNLDGNLGAEVLQKSE